jgi:hypothetical protein
MHLQTDGETALERKVQLMFGSATLMLLTVIAVSYHRSVTYFIRQNRKGITAMLALVTAAMLIPLVPKVNLCQG